MSKTARDVISESIADDIRHAGRDFTNPADAIVPANIIAALHSAGFVIVPKEPTEDIIFAGAGPHDVGTDPNQATQRLIASSYRAMIAKASQKPE